MTTKRTGTPWMTPAEYGRTLAGLSMNLVVRLGIDPDEAERRAREHRVSVLSGSKDWPHGWRDVVLEDPDGYTFAVGVALP